MKCEIIHGFSTIGGSNSAKAFQLKNLHQSLT